MFEEIKTTMQNVKGVLELDDRLVRAVFEPAHRAGVFEETEWPWLNSSNSCTTDDLIALLLPLSEYYQAINPPLSAALWGIWNTSRSFRRQRTLLSMLFERKKKDASAFIEVRGVVATAALQFSDGTALTIITSDAMTNYSRYKQSAESAINNLALLFKQAPGGNVP